MPCIRAKEQASVLAETAKNDPETQPSLCPESLTARLSKTREKRGAMIADRCTEVLDQRVFDARSERS
jgi:hypothetical protein